MIVVPNFRDPCAQHEGKMENFGDHCNVEITVMLTLFSCLVQCVFVVSAAVILPPVPALEMPPDGC